MKKVRAAARARKTMAPTTMPAMAPPVRRMLWWEELEEEEEEEEEPPSAGQVWPGPSW